MKRIMLFIAMVLSLVTFTNVNASAKSISLDEAKNVTKALGIMQGYDSGLFGDYDNVTRSQLAKILVASSKYRKLVPEVSSTSPFSDVKYDHWAASYVTVCVNAGYLTGCPDGTYKPEDNVLYEEALCGLLRLLGYEDSDFAGSYPYGVIALADETGISDNVNTAYAGKALTRREMAMMIYNTLNTNLKNSNQKLIQTLGYETTSDTITANEIVYEDAIGPIVVTDSSWQTDYNINASGLSVYKDGESTTINSVNSYDVLYYSKNLNTLWIYDDKVVGVYQSATPNKENPTSVVISGKTYEIEGAAKSAFSYTGYSYGSAVTAILDRDGKIIDVASSSEEKVSNVGVITASGTKTFTNANGNTYSGYYITFMSLSGNEYTYEVTKSMTSYIGKVVEVTFDDEVSVTSLSKSGSISGTINVSKQTIGKSSLSSNPVIVEYNTYSQTVERLTIDRLDGYTISNSDILYYTSDSKGNIDALVVSNVTFDSYVPGYIYSKTSGDSKSYYADIAGKTYNLSGSSYTTGAALFVLDGGSIKGARPLSSYSISNIKKVTSTYVETKNGTRYEVADDAVIYRANSGLVMLTNVDEITEDDSITAYMDTSASANGRVRVIIVH